MNVQRGHYTCRNQVVRSNKEFHNAAEQYAETWRVARARLIVYLGKFRGIRGVFSTLASKRNVVPDVERLNVSGNIAVNGILICYGCAFGVDIHSRPARKISCVVGIN